MIKRNKRILLYGDYNCDTGFSQVLTNLYAQVRAYINKGYQYDIIAINWYGDRMPDDYEIQKDEAGDFKRVEEMIDGKITKVLKRIKKTDSTGALVYSAYHNDGKEDVFGRNCFVSLLSSIDYSLVFMIQDLGTVTPIFPVIRDIKEIKRKQGSKLFKTIFYFPVDGVMLNVWLKDFDCIDRVICYTEYGKMMVQSMRPELKIGVILHGIDTGTFRRLPEEDVKEFREAFFGKNAGKTIVSNINRNQFRKDIPTTIFAFKEYKENYNPNSFLYLHMDPEDIQGWNLKVVMAQVALKQYEDYMFTPPNLLKEKPDPGFMNCIYNASDVYVTTTTGEGFGLTILEAMAAKTPVIAPYNTSIIEIDGGDKRDSPGDRISLLEIFRPFVSRFDNMIRTQCDIKEVADTIDCVVRNEAWMKAKAEEASKYAKSLNWRDIGKRWVEEFKKLL
jgi:glycosyltransferase involved in cell wall biosynthesis